MTMYDPGFRDLFSGPIREWDFFSDANGGDLSVMQFNSNPYKNITDLPGFNDLDQKIQDKLKDGHSIYSKSEIEGWTRIEFQAQQLIDMFGSDTIYVPQDEDLLFYKAMENWFEGLPYNPETDAPADGLELSDHKEYGLTSSLLSIFD